MIFFTADTHFGQQRTLELSKRPFLSVEEMDRVIVKNWNATVKPNDSIYHLGDWGALNQEIRDQLSGEIKFLPSQDYDQCGTIKFLLARSGTEIIEPNVIIKLSDHQQVLQLVHEPLSATPGNNFYLFGHIHKLQMVKCNGLCVSQDAHYFTPISLTDVLFFKNAIENHYDDNVFIGKLG